MACGFGELQWVRKLWKQTHEAYLRAVSLCLCLKLSGEEDLVSAWSMWRPSVGHRGLQASFALLLLWFRECVLSVSPSFMFSHSVCQKVCKCLWGIGAGLLDFGGLFKQAPSLHLPFRGKRLKINPRSTQPLTTLKSVRAAEAVFYFVVCVVVCFEHRSNDKAFWKIPKWVRNAYSQKDLLGFY